ncbi:PREDICTED: uncharacterized protein LOC108551448 [Eufriesea mexicana]|uniref:uncharacterized protein LOC108551448 n=1 Tax=Eufriesea mexicana TaxID=516756 RepID=UPI00083BAB61|nr:PREDICTED: uncharacterized protein LOC108551448 [Eufriesea mexicana]
MEFYGVNGGEGEERDTRVLELQRAPRPMCKFADENKLPAVFRFTEWIVIRGRKEWKEKRNMQEPAGPAATSVTGALPFTRLPRLVSRFPGRHRFSRGTNAFARP